MEVFNNILKQLQSFYGSLSPTKRIALVFISFSAIAIFITMGMWANEGEYVILWTGVEVEESQNIINNLTSKKIPYKAQDGGTTILVPRSKAAELRMELTTTGITQGGKIIGFEIFDKGSLGATSYIQKINFRRALEGELTKSIKSIAGVEKARVHLAMPEDKTFLVDQKQATASVVLKLSPGKVLTDNTVKGISNLVASAVEGLDADNVSILDQKGNLLSSNDNDPITKLTSSQLQYKAKMEGDLEKRVATILGRVVGNDNVEVRIAADIDFTKENFTQEQYDPEGSVLLSQTTTSEKFEGEKPNPGGIPGSRTNLPGQQGQVESAVTKNNQDRNTETLNYNVSKKVVNTVKSTGEIKKITMSVLVNTEPIINKDGKVEGFKKRDDLKQLEVLAKNAIGFSDTRGDAFTIESLSFKVETFEQADNFLREFTKNKLIRDLIWFGLIGTVILLFFFFIIRPFLNWVIDKTSEEKSLPTTVQEIETGATLAALKEQSLVKLDEKFNPEKAETEALIEKIKMLVSKNPAKAAGALRPWIARDAGKGSK